MTGLWPELYDYLLLPEKEEEALRSLCQMFSSNEVHFLHCFYNHRRLPRQEGLPRTTLLLLICCFHVIGNNITIPRLQNAAKNNCL